MSPASDLQILSPAGRGGRVKCTVPAIPWFRSPKKGRWSSKHLGFLALRRYVPYMRPYVGLMIVFVVSHLGTLAAPASIPKLIQYIITPPTTPHHPAPRPPK